MDRVWFGERIVTLRIRNLFSNFSPYSWELSTREISRMTGLPTSRIHRMDTNTSPFMPEKALTALSKKARSLPVNDYPDTSYFEIRKQLSKYCNTRVNQVIVTNGADEALDIIAKTLLDEEDEVVIPTPSYSMYRVSSEIMGAKVVFVPRSQEFGLDIKSIGENLTGRTKIIFICSPNSPTGNLASSEQITSLIELDPNCTVVIDEAYFEFSGKTSSDMIKKFDNLLIVRTLSKAFSMAGARVGYILASADSANKLNLVRPPNSVGTTSILMAQQALRDLGSMRRNVRTMVKERERMSETMRISGNCKVYPSEANFILFEPKRITSKKIHWNLMKLGFVLRDLSGVQGVENCLRVSVSTREVNDGFLRALSQSS